MQRNAHKNLEVSNPAVMRLSLEHASVLYSGADVLGLTPHELQQLVVPSHLVVGQHPAAGRLGWGEEAWARSQVAVADVELPGEL